MYKFKFIMIMFILLIYIFLYKLILVFQGEVVRYIINPILWLVITFSVYWFLIKGIKNYYKYKINVLYITIGTSLLYLILSYTLGFFIGFTNNPYSFTVSGIIINLFSILLIFILKEYIRNALIIRANNYNYGYKLLILALFILSDLNFIVIAKSFTSFSDLFNMIGEMIIPVISINLFMTYLCNQSGFIPAAVYRSIIFLPTLIVPIIPNYDWIIPTLFDILFPLATYLIIQYMINKQEKLYPKEIAKPFELKKWIITFGLTILIIMFGLGTFSIKPVVVITQSMEPTIKPGDLVIIEDINIESIKAGDIIQYKIEDYSVVHRVINVQKNFSGIILFTKGDNNKKRDRFPIKKDQLLGKMKYRIPALGYPAYLLRKIIGNKEVDVETGNR